MTASDDKDRLLNGIAQGNPEDESAFVNRFKRRFEVIALCNGVPQQDCEDIAQDALLAALGQIRRKLFRGDSSLSTWLNTIIHGKIADYQRGSYRRKHFEISMVDGLSANSSHFKDEGPEPHALAVRPQLELGILVREVLMRLPKQQRIILVLNSSVGLTIQEIARRFALPAGTVGRILSEAKKQFREILMGSEEFSPVPRLKESGDE